MQFDVKISYIFLHMCKYLECKNRQKNGLFEIFVGKILHGSKKCCTFAAGN